MSAIYLQSDFDAPSEQVLRAVGEGKVDVVPQSELTAGTLLAHGGLLTGMHLDQDALMRLREPLAAFLDAGGRWFFNGHMVRPLVEGVGLYRPIERPRRADFDLKALIPHPIFAGIDMKQLETNKGVAGFYGRGANPLPEGAVAVNGLGPGAVPVDWVWPRPAGGRVFSHAGNDLAQIGREWGLSPLLTDRILDWVCGGECL